MGNSKGYWSRPEVVERERLRNQKPHRKKARKAYKKTEAGKLAEKRYRQTAGSKRLQNNIRLKSRYGITQKDYDEMYEKQAGRCYICGLELKTLHVDHDHDSGAVRKLLCGNCNRGIGIFQDNAELLEKASDYIKEHNV